MGYEVRKVKIPSMEMVIPAYYTIATAEASATWLVIAVCFMVWRQWVRIIPMF